MSTQPIVISTTGKYVTKTFQQMDTHHARSSGTYKTHTYTYTD